MTQVAVGGDLELERVAAQLPRRGFDDADEDLVLRLRRSERAEVVLAEQELRRRRKPLLVDRPRHPPAAPLLERRRRAATVDSVAVAARAGGVARVEVRCSGLGRDDGNLVGQRGVQRLGRTLGRRAPVDVDARDLAECVHARVRSSRDSKLLGARIELAERPTDLPLHRAQFRLRRPAAKPRAVVLDR